MALITPPDLASASLSLCIFLSTYTSYLAGQPPNPTPYDSTEPDSMSYAVTPRALFIRSSISLTLGVYHALVSLTYPNPPPALCPNPANLSPYLFTWTPYSAICIATIFLGCYIRLTAFSILGQSFTFRLKEPQKLVTSGLYRYMQHPSYTGKSLIVYASWVLIRRSDGIVGCWLPTWAVGATWFWRTLGCLYGLGVLRVTWKRVSEEEVMLKRTFGKEWEEWHARTSRFIPGLF
jgi:protein-S-isoprenylcysteine O-methyltransferase Ste14